MLPLIEANRDDIAELCQRFHVSRMDVFGSASRAADFDPASSDIDMLVAYQPNHTAPTMAEFLQLRDALSSMLGRSVDLVMEGAVQNPFFRADIEQSRQLIYAA